MGALWFQCGLKSCTWTETALLKGDEWFAFGQWSKVIGFKVSDKHLMGLITFMPFECLTHWTGFLDTGGLHQSATKTHFGIPQDSVPGPLLFSVGMLHLWHIIPKPIIRFYCYADDTKLYCHYCHKDWMSYLEAAFMDLIIRLHFWNKRKIMLERNVS